MPLARSPAAPVLRGADAPKACRPDGQADGGPSSWAISAAICSADGNPGVSLPRSGLRPSAIEFQRCAASSTNSGWGTPRTGRRSRRQRPDRRPPSGSCPRRPLAAGAAPPRSNRSPAAAAGRASRASCVRRRRSVSGPRPGTARSPRSAGPSRRASEYRSSVIATTACLPAS